MCDAHRRVVPGDKPVPSADCLARAGYTKRGRRYAGELILQRDAPPDVLRSRCGVGKDVGSNWHGIVLFLLLLRGLWLLCGPLRCDTVTVRVHGRGFRFLADLLRESVDQATDQVNG